MKIGYKAIWLIESELAEPLSLEQLAQRLGVSAFHLARAFSTSHGLPLMQYVRRRRLSDAARRLLGTDDRIIDIALEAGYNSQEAFTRAFQAEFSVSPRSCRERRPVLEFTEAILMNQDSKIRLQAPRLEKLDAIRLVGLSRRYNEQTSARIPEQWMQFNQAGIASADNPVAYGVCHNLDSQGNLDYLCAVQVDHFDQAAESRDRLTIPPQTYAVFSHNGHVSEIRNVWQAIWNHGLTDAGLVASEGPEFEKYGPQFNPQSGEGGFEIWIPVKQPVKQLANKP